jgi:hypothetical protein
VIDRLCENLERQATANHHQIGVGFREALMLGKVRMLRMDCQCCDYFMIIDPISLKHIQSYPGPCRGNNNG